MKDKEYRTATKAELERDADRARRAKESQKRNPACGGVSVTLDGVGKQRQKDI